MLPVVVRDQSMDSTPAEFVGVPLASLCASQNSSSDDLATHFKLADILKRLTCQVVIFIYGDHLCWIEGPILEKRIDIGHDVSS
jgi:hypothetical protein